jgi:hypothetical protein
MNLCVMVPIVAALLSIVATSARAAVVYGFFYGVVTSSVDVNNDFGQGSGTQTLAGQTINGQIVYDSSAIGTNLTTPTSNFSMGGSLSTITISESIGNFTQTYSSSLMGAVSVTQNLQESGDTWSNFFVAADQGISSGTWFSESAFNSPTTLLANMADVGSADFGFLDGQSVSGRGAAALGDGSSYSFDVTGLSVSSEPPSPVPLPGGLGLFGSAVVGMIAAARCTTRRRVKEFYDGFATTHTKSSTFRGIISCSAEHSANGERSHFDTVL